MMLFCLFPLLHTSPPRSPHGKVTSTSAAFRVRGPGSDDGNQREFVVSINLNLAIESGQVMNVPVAYSGYTPDKHGVKALDLDGMLVPQTAYYYGITGLQRMPNSAVVAVGVGFFITPTPQGSRMDFMIATGSCADTWSKSSSFSEVLSLNPLVFFHLGDMHYEDLNTLNVNKRLRVHNRVVGSPLQRLLYMHTIFLYMWGNHDWLGNNQDSEDAEVASVAKWAYSLRIPHYPLGSSSSDMADAPKYQAFTIGTMHFINTDLRSESFHSTEYYPGRIYSTEQKESLLGKLDLAANYGFVVWATTRPWTEPIKVGSDSWGGLALGRGELLAYIAATIGGGSSKLVGVVRWQSTSCIR